MRIWFDADNGPHVLILRPLASELARRGYPVRFTARDRASTCELLDLYGLPYTRVGGEYSNGLGGKVLGTLGRAVQLFRAMRWWHPDVSFGHGSRALPIASRLMGTPTLTMYDHEWVNHKIFNLLCRDVLLPAVIGEDRCREAGIAVGKVRFYPGLKEELYVRETRADPHIVADLGLEQDKIKVLLRPPATSAHYHSTDSEILFDVVWESLLTRGDVQMVLLPRTEKQAQLVRRSAKAQVIVPDRVYDGPRLIASMDMVVGGGGTMTREAAVIGVPSYSYFCGKKGRVDTWLEQKGQLVMLASPEDVKTKLRVARRCNEGRRLSDKGLVQQIANIIEGASQA